MREALRDGVLPFIRRGVRLLALLHANVIYSVLRLLFVSFLIVNACIWIVRQIIRRRRFFQLASSQLKSDEAQILNDGFGLGKAPDHVAIVFRTEELLEISMEEKVSKLIAICRDIQVKYLTLIDCGAHLKRSVDSMSFDRHARIMGNAEPCEDSVQFKVAWGGTGDGMMLCQVLSAENAHLDQLRVTNRLGSHGVRVSKQPQDKARDGWGGNREKRDEESPRGEGENGGTYVGADRGEQGNGGRGEAPRDTGGDDVSSFASDRNGMLSRLSLVMKEVTQELTCAGKSGFPRVNCLIILRNPPWQIPFRTSMIRAEASTPHQCYHLITTATARLMRLLKILPFTSERYSSQPRYGHELAVARKRIQSAAEFCYRGCTCALQYFIDYRARRRWKEWLSSVGAGYSVVSPLGANVVPPWILLHCEIYEQWGIEDAAAFQCFEAFSKTSQRQGR